MRIIPFFLCEISENIQRAAKKILCEFNASLYCRSRCRNNMENLCIEKRNREDSTHMTCAKRDAIITENETSGNARQHWQTSGKAGGG